MKPFFSIIIPTFNSKNDVQRAVHSVLSQTYHSYEILVIDDGSTDGTENIIRSISDSRLKYYWNENSGGPAKPRNFGISIATGNWLCFLDADDWWFPEKLKFCFDNIDESSDLLYHDLLVKDGTNRLLVMKTVGVRVLKEPIIIDLLLNGNPIPTSSVVVRRSLMNEVNGFSEDRSMIAAEDYNAWLKVAANGGRLKLLRATLGCYELTNNGISRRNMLQPTRAAVSDFIGALTPPQVINVEALLQYSNGSYLFKNKDFYSAVPALHTAIKSSLFNIKLKAFLMLVVCYFRKCISIRGPNH